MRRKCFFLLIVVLILLYGLDALDIPLAGSIEMKFFEESKDYTGKVTGIQEKEGKASLQVKVISADGNPADFPERVLLNLYSEDDKKLRETRHLLNQNVSFTVKLEHPSGQRNPYCFDYAGYLKSRGVGAVAVVNTVDPVEENLTFREKYERTLYVKKCHFADNLSEETKGIIMGILFGDTSYLGEDDYDMFRKNGTAHILAVSGLHVGIIYGLYKKLAGRRKSVPLLIMLAMILYTYGELAAWSPSVSRAVLMIVMKVSAEFFDLRYDMLTAMSTVALILIINNPYVIFGAGFQMSFLAISSIAFLRPVIPSIIPEAAAATIAVYLGLLPYQIYKFNYFSLTALIANIPMIYLAGYFVPLAVLCFLTFVFMGSPGVLLNLTDAMGRLVFFVNRFTSMKGHGGFDTVSPPLWIVLAAGALMFFLASETFEIMRLRGEVKKISACCGCIAAGALMLNIASYCPVSSDDIVFVDVGQGDCIHIKSGSTDVLIDGGGSANYNVGAKILKPYLLKTGSGSVELAVATHQHMDHIKGLTELGEVYPVDKLICGLTAGTEIDVTDEIKILTLWPEEIPEDKGQDENKMCSVFMIFYKEYKILVTGDLDEEGEKNMMKKYEGTDILSADILKIGHHGSSTSTCDEFLEVVNPTYAVIQTGKNNYGHPSPKTIEKCAKKCIIVYRNDYYGAVGFSFKRKGIRCHTVTESGE